MKLERILSIVLLSVSLLVLPVAAVAKGPVEEVTVRGPGLGNEVEITDEVVLRAIGEWGQRLTRKAVRPTGVTVTGDYLLLTFYQRGREGTLMVAHSLRYYPSPSDATPALVLNFGWFEVNPEAEGVLQTWLQQQQMPPHQEMLSETATARNAAGTGWTTGVVFALLLVGLLVLYQHQRMRHATKVPSSQG